MVYKLTINDLSISEKVLQKPIQPHFIDSISYNETDYYVAYTHINEAVAPPTWENIIASWEFDAKKNNRGLWGKC